MSWENQRKIYVKFLFTQEKTRLYLNNLGEKITGHVKFSTSNFGEGISKGIRNNLRILHILKLKDLKCIRSEMHKASINKSPWINKVPEISKPRWIKYTRDNRSFREVHFSEVL